MIWKTIWRIWIFRIFNIDICKAVVDTTAFFYKIHLKIVILEGRKFSINDTENSNER